MSCILGTVNAVLFLKRGLETIASLLFSSFSGEASTLRISAKFYCEHPAFCSLTGHLPPHWFIWIKQVAHKLYGDSYWSMEPRLHPSPFNAQRPQELVNETASLGQGLALRGHCDGSCFPHYGVFN